MHSLYKWLLSSFATITLVGFVETATAGVIIDIAESNGNVVATVSGSLAYLGLGTVNVPFDATASAAIGNFGAVDFFGAANGGTTGTTSYAMSGPLSAWGNSPFFTSSSSFSLTGTNYFVFYTGQYIEIGTYNFGDPINATATFNNTTLAAMGLVNPGSYVYTVGSGLDTDTITFNIGGGGGGAAVPEPSSLAVVSIAAAAAAIRGRRNKAKAKA